MFFVLSRSRYRHCDSEKSFSTAAGITNQKHRDPCFSVTMSGVRPASSALPVSEPALMHPPPRDSGQNGDDDHDKDSYTECRVLLVDVQQGVGAEGYDEAGEE